MVTVPQVPFVPTPMLLGAPVPFVAVTLVTPLVMVMLPHLFGFDPPPSL
jgi:hypothetical protein